MLRRSASLVALFAVIAAPAVTSTRLFCRYTGEEIIGCDEAGAPEHAQLRAGDCCQQRTFHALDGMRRAEERRQEAPAPIASYAAPAPVAEVFAVASPARWLTAAPPVGPPAFISHRALLI